MKSTKLSLINLNATIRPMVLEAAREAFPELEVLETSTLEDGSGSTTAASPDLVVLSQPDAALAARATQAADAEGLPRWAIVILGEGNSDLAETVPPGEWTSLALSRIFRSVVMQHDLLRENLRLRGDLKTVARRISHDLRTPAGCIQTSADLMNELAVGKGAGLSSLADVFRQSSGEISQLIDRMSFVLRASAEPTALTPVDMGAIVAAALRKLEPEIRPAGIVITQPDQWPEVAGVSNWLQMVWYNLLRNALQHGGTAPQIKLGWNVEKNGHRFFVADRGPGVLPAVVGSLFVPFDRLHEVRTRGLGLSIVHRLVTLQGGTCGYEKLADAGASFHFTLP